MFNPPVTSPVFTGDDKAMRKVGFLREMEEFGANRPVEGTTSSLLDYMGHLPAHLFQRLHPTIYQVELDAAAHQNAIAAALAAEPPTPAPEPPPASSATPKVPSPVAPGILPPTATAVALTRHTQSVKIYADFTLGMREWREATLARCDPIDIEMLRVRGGTSGLAGIKLPDIWDYFFTMYDTPSPEQIAALKAKITAPLDRSLPLSLNLERRLRYNADLLEIAPHHALSECMLYAVLLDLCLSPELRLRPVVQKFTDQPGYLFGTARATPFVAFMSSHYLTHIYDDGTGRKAFLGETGYLAPSEHRLAFASVAADPVAPPLALAAAQPTWNPTDWAEFQRLRIAAAAAPPPPPGGTGRGPRAPWNSSPKPAHPHGKICFECGWQRDHNSKKCPVMEANPSAYTLAQRTLVSLPSTANPVIDGKRCNTKCAPGVSSAP